MLCRFFAVLDRGDAVVLFENGVKILGFFKSQLGGDIGDGLFGFPQKLRGLFCFHAVEVGHQRFAGLVFEYLADKCAGIVKTLAYICEGNLLVGIFPQVPQNGIHKFYMEIFVTEENNISAFLGR